MKLDSTGEFWLMEGIDNLAILATLIKKSNIGPLLPEWVKTASRDTTPITPETIERISNFLTDPLFDRLEDGGHYYRANAQEWLRHVKENLDFAKDNLYDPEIRAQQEEERRNRPFVPPVCPDCGAPLELKKFNNAQIDWSCGCGYKRPAICWL